MPLKLVPPRKGKSPHWSIRGTHLKVYVDRSSGTPKRSVAGSIRDGLERKIECGEYPAKQAASGGEQRTFLSAAVAYLKAGKRRRYVKALIRHFGERPLDQINQAAVDLAADTICRPGSGGGARNAAVYTPVSAILHHAGVDIRLNRPKGAKGRIVTDWLRPDDASSIILAADDTDPELGLLLRFLLYTGVRLGAALALERESVADDGTAWVRHQKGQPAADVQLRADLRERLKAHLSATEPRRRVFRLHQGGWLKHLLVRAKLGALGLPCPERRPKGWKPPPNRFAFVNFHTFRHTWATWMRRYGRVDIKGLVATNNWRDERSAARYAHAVASEEWQAVDLLPPLRRGKSVE